MSTVASSSDLYDATARASATCVISQYSTSFARACRLLDEPVRGHVRDVYGLVRLADELVDAPSLPLTRDERAALLDDLQAETARATARGFSTNLVVHAFALTARECGIGPDLVDPFFASMRTDLVRSTHDERTFATYVHGSAEVVGLMCLRIFLASEPGTAAERDARYADLADGARRLGAAFQKVNFLRDLAADRDDLGRAYFPGLGPGSLTDARRDALLDDVDADLAAAARAIDALPPSSRRGVRAAHDLFAALSRRLRATPATTIEHRRVRVPGPVKALVVGRILLGQVTERLLPTRTARP
ncbi:phytoene synthase [Cellulomonas chitinilytica]|uniref:Phytoene synthase n=1 Tax=Cellulomonas chitinilytica TaxID=398759 RepID=A0A919NZJ9_9CELL|nr:squalene/phytoene synthase family protein [Cellulomonas chitinilytica]GIG20457.1 phytoene synthase [Cellulomonas chitinilytica]